MQQNKLMRYLQKDAGTVAGLVVGALGTAMLHVFEHFQRLVDKFVRLISMNIDKHSNTTRIMFVF